MTTYCDHLLEQVTNGNIYNIYDKISYSTAQLCLKEIDDLENYEYDEYDIMAILANLSKRCIDDSTISNINIHDVSMFTLIRIQNLLLDNLNYDNPPQDFVFLINDMKQFLCGTIWTFRGVYPVVRSIRIKTRCGPKIVDMDKLVKQYLGPVMMLMVGVLDEGSIVYSVPMDVIGIVLVNYELLFV